MSAEVKILVEGYTNADSVAETGDEKTCATITLVKDGDIIMVVDPGVLESQQILIDALAKENLTVQDVNVVCITHSHIDHYRNAGMFPNAKVLEYFGLWNKNTVQEWQEHFSENIQIARTPGHDYTGITLFVNTDNGIVAICGDVFWKENHPENPEDDAYASDKEKLKESRNMVLRMSDWIIPGHAAMFKTNKEKLSEEKIKKSTAENIFAICKKCHQPIKNKLDSCRCRSYFCYRCCECGLDCNLCNCSHKQK